MSSQSGTLFLPTRVIDSIPCPPDDLLLTFDDDQTDGALSTAVSQHLATCPHCQLRISTLQHRLPVTPDSPTLDYPLPGSVPVSRAKAAPPASKPNVNLPSGSGVDEAVPGSILKQTITRSIPRRLNEYELLERIGMGGMGQVFRARHTRLHRTVAVKVLPDSRQTEPSALMRMQRESAAAGRVAHENIVYATDAGECAGINYLVMEYVEGLDLSRLMRRLGRLPVADACEIIRQAALGVGHIAACRMVHRDLKPSNLMLAEDGTVKILDLGLARLDRSPLDDDGETTQAGFLLGTADYVAPEQIESPHDADVRSDLYSLGCAFYKLLAGRAPFGTDEHGSVNRKVTAHRSQQAVPIKELRPEVPGEIADLIDRLLAKEPAARPQHPREVATALAPFAVGADLSALVNSAQERADLDGIPIPDISHTPPAADSSTAEGGNSATPFKPAELAKSSWSDRFQLSTLMAVSLLGIVALGALAGAVWAVRGRDQVTDFTLPRTLLASQHEEPLEWVGHLESPDSPFFDSRRGELGVRPSSFQLIPMGHYDGTPGTFKVQMSQEIWHGDLGLYFGARTEPDARTERGYKPYQLTTFQLFEIEYFPRELRPNWEDGPLFRVYRQRAAINVSPVDKGVILGTGITEPFPAPRGTHIELEITFSRSGCEKLVANGQPLWTLCSPERNARYVPDDYIGSFGFYCKNSLAGPGRDTKGITWFSNIEFTPAE
jgi:serine/threonine protein kinase